MAEQMRDYSSGVGRKFSPEENERMAEALTTVRADPYPREIGQLLKELGEVQSVIDTQNTRKRELIEHYYILLKQHQHDFDNIVNRPEEGEVSISRGERY